MQEVRPIKVYKISACATCKFSGGLSSGNKVLCGYPLIDSYPLSTHCNQHDYISDLYVITRLYWYMRHSTFARG